MQETYETQVQSLGREDPLEATRSSIVAGRVLWTEEPGGLQSIGLQRINSTQVTAHERKHTHTHTHTHTGRSTLRPFEERSFDFLGLFERKASPKL